MGLGMVVKEGGVVRGGCEVVGLEKDGKRVKGVVLKSGEVVRGDIVLVCPPSLMYCSADADGRLLLELGMSPMTKCVLIAGHLPFVHLQASISLSHRS